MATLGHLRALGPLLVAFLAAAGPLAAQEAVGDSASAERDSAAAPADSVASSADTTPVERPGLAFPADLVGRELRSASQVRSWEKPALLDATAVTLAGFLEDHAPGVHLLRAGYFFGPHQVADGLWGPASVRVVVDGRELLPLAGGQPDLARISLVGLQRIELERRPGETVIRLTTVEHDGGEAYSRVEAGTGQPSADMVNGVFLNNAGRHLGVGAAVSYLNIGGGSAAGNRLDALGKAAWMPFGPGFGVELDYQSESVERGEGGTSTEFTRSGFALRMRARPSEGVRIDAWGATSTRDPRPPFLTGPEAGDGSEPEESATLGADQLGADLAVLEGPVRLDARAVLLDGGGLPEGETELRGAVRVGPVVAEAGYRGTSWTDFSTSGLSAGIALKPESFPVALRGGIAGGSRAVPSPGRSVGDSAVFDFDAATAGLDVNLGPYEIGVEIRRQSQELRPAFGASFDTLVPIGPRAEVTFREARFAGPLLPLGALEDRLLVSGSWQSASFGDEESLPYYVPRELGRASLQYHDSFFEDNLGVRLALKAERRGEMVSAEPGSATPDLIEARTVLGTDLVLRIDVFRIWWRAEGLRGEEHRDFIGLPFPAQRNLFGVRWEFFN